MCGRCPTGLWIGRVLMAGLLIGLLSSPGLSNPKSGDDADPANPALSGAVEKLRAEMAAYIADPVNLALRTKSDFFTPATAPDEAAIVAALGRRLDRNPVIDSYIKWQLLSAIAGEFSQDHHRTVILLYRRAPGPVQLAGVTKQEQMQLDQVALRGSESDVSRINEQWVHRNEEARRANQIILAYRDELFGRLPLNAEVIELGLRDAVARASAGLDPRKFSALVEQRTRLWAINAAPPPQQLQALSRLFLSLREEPAVEVYSAIEWKNKRLQWKKETRRVNPRVDAKNPQNDSFYVLAGELAQMARNPSGGLKLKTD